MASDIHVCMGLTTNYIKLNNAKKQKNRTWDKVCLDNTIALLYILRHVTTKCSETILHQVLQHCTIIFKFKININKMKLSNGPNLQPFSCARAYTRQSKYPHSTANTPYFTVPWASLLMRIYASFPCCAAAAAVLFPLFQQACFHNNTQGSQGQCFPGTPLLVRHSSLLYVAAK